MRDWRLWRQGRPYSAKSSSRILPQQGIKMNDKKQEILSYSDIGVLVSDGTSPQTFPMHWHDSPEFILAKKDGCKFGISDQEYILNKNDILLIWPRELHWVIYTPEKATLILQCTPFLLDYNNEYRVYETQIQKYHYIRCDESSKFYRSLRDDLLKAKDIYIGAESFAETKLKILLLQLLLKIMQKAIEEESKGDSERLPAYVQDKIRSACAYISDHRNEDLTLADAAASAELSEFYFSRLFKQTLGVSFSDYLAEQRISLALKLLANPTLTISEVAFGSGFQSISNFNRVFRIKVGTTPKEYRSMCQATSQLEDTFKNR